MPFVLALQSKIFYRYDLIIGYSSFTILFSSLFLNRVPFFLSFDLIRIDTHTVSLSTSFHKVFAYTDTNAPFLRGPQSKSNIAYINDSFLWTEVSKFFGKSLKVNNQKLLLFNDAWCISKKFQLNCHYNFVYLNFCAFMRLTELIHDFISIFS